MGDQISFLAISTSLRRMVVSGCAHGSHSECKNSSYSYDSRVCRSSELVSHTFFSIYFTLAFHSPILPCRVSSFFSS